MKEAIRVSGVCLLLAGFVLAGCGGGDESTPAGSAAGNGSGQEAGGSGGSVDSGETPEIEPTSETKAKYVAKANAICEKRRKQIRAQLTRVVKALPKNSGEEAGLDNVVEDAFAPGLEAELDELLELGAPQGGEEQIEEIFAAIEAVIAEMREDPAAFGRSPNSFKESERLTAAYGIDECGRVL